MTPIFDEIRAKDLADWADQAESERLMPSLIQQLILSSGANVRSCRFLSHEQTNLSGWDGICEAEAAGLYVPEGKSGWDLRNVPSFIFMIRGWRVHCSEFKQQKNLALICIADHYLKTW